MAMASTDHDKTIQSIGHTSIRQSLWGCLMATGILTLLIGCATTGNMPASPPPAPIVQPVSVPTSMPPVLPSQTVKAKAPNGSLWASGNTSLYQDIKARHVGDILTIVVSEESKASKSAQTGTSKSKTFNGSANFNGLTAGTKNIMGPVNFAGYDGQFDSGFKGQGSTTKNDSMSTYMTATVVDILPSGNLLIRGSRWTKVNSEMQQIVLEGVVRPNDVTRNNTVLSQNIADAKIFFEGKGPLTQQQRPGWLLQLMDLVSPF